MKAEEYYFPTDEDLLDLLDHAVDCNCPECKDAKRSRYGAYHNGNRWIEIL